ncbi:hypothetical protein JCM5296_002890 [Sporobolomyces johnsonii]
MPSRSFKPSLADAVDSLLSLRSTPTQHARALAQLEAVVAPFALDPDPALLDAFLLSQDSIERNVTASLLEWLGRSLMMRQEAIQGDDADQIRENLVRCLGLIQGLLLLHRRSQRLFVRRASLEYVLAVLDLVRLSHPPSPLPSATPLASPVVFPASPAFRTSDPFAASAATENTAAVGAVHLALAALDTLLCALVDRPKNMRAFEEIGGLTSIVKVLKDRNVAQVVRIKVIELLYYYLLPETSKPASGLTYPPSPDSSFATSTSASTMSTLSSAAFANAKLPNLLATAAGDFVPQTPVKPKPTPRSRPPSTNRFTSESLVNGGSESGSASSASSREGSPIRTPRRTPGLRHKRSQSLLSFPATNAPADVRSLSASTATPSASTPRSRLTSRRLQATILENDIDSTPRAPRVSRLLDPRSPSAASTSTSASAPFDPASPRRGHRRSQSTSAALDGSTAFQPRASRSATDYPLRERRPSRPSDAATTEMPPPPVPPPRSASISSARRHSSSYSDRPLSLSAASRSTSCPVVPPASAARTKHTRTEQEKKELLRKVMPNVDALEERFKAMGLGLS